MGRLSIAWQILTNGKFAERVSGLLQAASEQKVLSKTEEPPETAPDRTATPRAAAPQPPARTDAVTLLATLQREGRFIDFLKEPISAYTDAQVGAAVRDIHRDCNSVLERQFALRPVVAEPEGSMVDVGSHPDPGKFKLSGQAGTGQSVVGKLLHHGWQVTQCHLPQWTGSPASVNIIAPAEIELPKS